MRLIFASLATIISLFSYGQSYFIQDSLELILDNLSTNQDLVKFELYISLAHYSPNAKEDLDYSLRALNLAKKYDDDLFMAIAFKPLIIDIIVLGR